ncbi:MAG TPA: PepSY-associated TM helix domain-containing protein [Vicinamibacterales bacterium]
MHLLRVVHRWLGLLLALIVTAVALTGGLLLLRDPYYRFAYPELALPVTPEEAARRAEVLETIESQWQHRGLRLVKFPREGVNAFHLFLSDGREAFVDPRTAAVIDEWHWSDRVPAFVFELHAHLLSEPVGTVVNGVAALCIVFMGITGLVLWWPGRRRAFRLRGAVPRQTTPASLLRSHAAVGTLALVPVLLFAATGAAIVFYEQTGRIVTALLDARPAEVPGAHVQARSEPRRPWREILDALDRTFPEGEKVFYYPGNAQNARLMFRKRLPGEWHPNGRSYVLIDPYTASVVQAIDARAQGAGTRLMHAIYPVHAAKVGGAWMAAAAAVAAIALAWLAVGGAWVWVGRRVRQTARRSRRVSVAVPELEPHRHAEL